MAEVLIDSYSETNQNANSALYSGFVTAHGNSFTNLNTRKLSSCKFYLKKVTAPTGNITVTLHAHSGTYGTSSVPTGDALATSDAYDIASLTTSYQLIPFTFTGVQQIMLTPNTYYFLAVNYSGGDGSNYLHIGYDDTTPAHSGNAAYYYSAAWTAQAAVDLCFYIYGTSVSGGFSGGQPWIF